MAKTARTVFWERRKFMDEIFKEYHFGFAPEMLEPSTSTTLIIFGEPARQLVARLYGEKSAVRTSKWCYSKESNNTTDNLLFHQEFFDTWATLPEIEACTRLLGMMKFQSKIFSNCNILYSVPHLLPPVIDEIEKTEETFENDEGPIDLPAMQDQFEATRFQGRSLAHKKIREGGGDEKEKFSPNF
jgi:hypothetical protein